ncbi:MAG: methyl-accepting chemotaxis protein [Trichocoleus desertorum ATA4-8-CV12]|nr:methyl-accepting chemotaxis protein [Trichocoleus desertorum ATA4-8-CV12]
MLKNMSLQSRLIGSFGLMSVIVLVASSVGWMGISRLSKHIDTLSKTSLPSVAGIWKVNEGQTQVQSSMRALVNPEISEENKQTEMTRIKSAWKQIDDGFKEYESAPQTSEEAVLYKGQFKPHWDDWKQDHEKFLQLYEAARQNSLTEAEVKNLNQFLAFEERQSFDIATEDLLRILDINAEVARVAQVAAAQDSSQASFWVLFALIAGPTVAIALGTYLSRTIAKPLGTKVANVVVVAEQISAGDLTTQVEAGTNSNDEVDKLLMAFQAMTHNLNSLIRQVQQSGIQVTTSATKIAASGKQLEATVTEQVAATNEVVVTAKEIAATSGELANTMEEVATMSQETTVAAAANQEDLIRMATTMRQLVAATNSISAKLEVISEKANNINSVVNTITKVADQTNLLSLNAAIEAEKAGEYGLGFAVVAREIRRLADQTAVATLDIEQMVKEMQSSVSTGVMEMDKFTKEVGRGMEDVGNISEQLGEIIEQVQALSPRFSVVNQGMEAQSQGAQQISEAMVQLSETSVQTADALQEINRAIDQLNQAAQGLRQEISRFKVGAIALEPQPLYSY